MVKSNATTGSDTLTKQSWMEAPKLRGLGKRFKTNKSYIAFYKGILNRNLIK